MQESIIVLGRYSTVGFERMDRREGRNGDVLRDEYLSDDTGLEI
jgi:hypothetical protein